MMFNNEKPFVFGVATSGNTFTDRVLETERLLNSFRYGINTILISPRRIGKTSLVNKVAALAQKEGIIVVKLDIYACRSEKEFIDALSTAIIRATSSKFEEFVQNAKLFFSRFSPKISFGDSPMHDFSVSLDYRGENNALEDVLRLPERIAEQKGKRVVVCIDEFQQVGEYNDSITFQKKLRTIWQHQHLTSYCLYGSKKHLMSALFLNNDHPFYKFGETIYLKNIPEADWVEYIVGRFDEYEKNIAPYLAKQLCQIVECNSSYVQQLSWLLWLRTKDTATEENLELAVQDLISECSPLFYQQTESLTSPQLQFLYALIDGINKGFMHKDVLEKYNLGTSANITRIKKALTEKEFIDIDDTGELRIADPVLVLWLKRLRNK